MISIPASRWIPESEPKTSIQRRIINEKTLGKLHDRMNVIDWSHILSETNPEVGYRDFIKLLSREIDDCCPKRIAKNKEQNSKWITLEIKQKCQIKRQLCPKRIAKNKEQNSKWITLEIKQKCQIKRQLYGIAKNKEQNSKWITLEIKQKCQIKRQLYEDMSNNLIDKAIYMEYCKNLDFEIRTLKKNCNSQYIMNSVNKSKATWNLVKKITGGKDNRRADINDINLELSKKNNWRQR
ncbi:hypothetical protein QE152_g25091 [Popillia japonica]|uniref:Endonuclease-reverse transcriptase n=1 Tax=Popillia japonica TaxID=7064 RepID=A0AAW1K259_POPJA